MKIDDCFQLGAIIKTHGFKGEVVLQLDVDNPHEYENLESVFLDQSGKLVPFFISKSLFQGEKIRILFEDVDDEISAKKLVGAKAFLPADLLPELGDEDYYFHEVVGYKVVNEGKELGEIFEIYDHPSNPLFGFKLNSQEVLVPFQDEFVRSVDKSSREIHVNLPDGYLDIYLNS